jgi:hypothetical protein
MNGDYVRIWKEEATAYFKVISQHSLEEVEEMHESPAVIRTE